MSRRKMLCAGWSVEEIEVLDVIPGSGECSFTARQLREDEMAPNPCSPRSRRTWNVSAVVIAS
jgi:hypothetical protein